MTNKTQKIEILDHEEKMIQYDCICTAKWIQNDWNLNKLISNWFKMFWKWFQIFWTWFQIDSNYFGTDSKHFGNDSKHFGNDSNHFWNNSIYFGNDSNHLWNDSKHFGNDSKYFRNDSQFDSKLFGYFPIFLDLIKLWNDAIEYVSKFFGFQNDVQSW